MKKALTLLAALLTAGCTSTSVMPVAQNQFMLSTSAAPVCGASGAQKVASKMAAVETVKQGFERYAILGAQNQNNVSIVNTAPTGAMTTGTMNTYGSTTTGTFNTTYVGGGPIVTGSRDAQLSVMMFNPGDRGYSNALDAKQQLGDNWRELVETGVTTCGQV